jgi:hypothetical protein
LETTSQARRRPEGAGRGVTLSLGPPPPLLHSSRHSSRPAIQKVSNNEAFMISIARIKWVGESNHPLQKSKWVGESNPSQKSKWVGESNPSQKIEMCWLP